MLWRLAAAALFHADIAAHRYIRWGAPEVTLAAGTDGRAPPPA
jgi:hypothetical protein